MTTSFVSGSDVAAVMPEIALSAAGCVLLLLEAFAPGLRKYFASIAIASVGAYLFAFEKVPAAASFGRTLDGSMAAQTFGLLLGLCLILTLLIARPYLEAAAQARLAPAGGEFYVLLLWAAVGLSLLARGMDLLVIFLGLETFSLAFYVLAAFFRGVPASSEAGLKYFLTGAFASSFTLFGIAFLFGAAGSTRLAALATVPPSALLACGFVFFLSGFAFKIALAPFHSWAPDVYAGMPTPAVAFLSIAPKAASLIVLYRLTASLSPAASARYRIAFAVLAAISMSLGNLVALAQRDLKRLLAYSGIAHMGYAAIGLAVFGRAALAAIFVYVFAYAVSNIGAFAATAALFRDETRPHSIGLLAGAGRTNPFPAFVLGLSMLSLGGIPATAGFIGKFFVFKTAIEHGLLWLAIVGVLNSLVSLGYYLRVIYVLSMRDPIPNEAAPPLALDTRLALALCAAGTLAIGIFPARIWDIARVASISFPLPRP